jgi:hypothetical protein
MCGVYYTSHKKYTTETRGNHCGGLYNCVDGKKSTGEDSDEKTYTAGALATSSRSTDLGRSNGIAISAGTYLVGYDCEFDVPKSCRNTASTWQMLRSIWVTNQQYKI